MTIKNKASHLDNSSRRDFIIKGTMLGGGLMLGIGVLPDSVYAQAGPKYDPNTPTQIGEAEVNAWVSIKPDDAVYIRIARSEMGQGTRTGLAQLVTEELECNWKKVKTQSATPGQSLARKRVWGEHGTGGSRGIRISEDYVRRGAAAARIMLMQAAANQWSVPVSELTVDKGVITHVSTGRKTTYGKVAELASTLTPPDPKSITLRDPRNWKVAGQPYARLDTANKVNGSKVYGVDLQLPGMLCASVKACPVFGGKLVSYDEAKIKGMRGVKGVVKIDDSTLAVVADTWWHANSALHAMPIVWDEGKAASVSQDGINKMLRDGLDEQGDFWQRKEGDAPAAINSATKKVEAIYYTPYRAHVTMEPMNATVKITGDRAEAWVPTQNGEGSHAALSEATGLPLANCEVYKLDSGCGLGRRGSMQDFTTYAAKVAQKFPGIPVKVIWSREEDMTHDYYHPIAMAKMTAGIDSSGNVTGMHIKVAGQSINATLAPQAIKDGKDERQLQGFYEKGPDAQLGYTFPTLLTEYVMKNTHVPVGPWRGVNTNQNGIFMECFMDECAKAAGKDPVKFRQALMQSHPKHLGVLNAAAKKADWDKPLPAGTYRGVAQFMGYASYSACVAEVTVQNNVVKVTRLVFALNSGHVVNPYLTREQIEGSVAMALGAIFLPEISVENGRIKQQNLDTYPLLKLSATPRIETVLVPSFDFWGGVGEPTICVVGPAVANAISAAIGRPVRNFPLSKEGLSLA
ncbi:MULTISPECIES: xanthine dehydrogenase family protein molybdopterin-binding subunit [unclassified Polynucleobacter]|uniref:xanthine dehydrogenase family protein molybdopterin-binding subunit n=1 Tax=unclassified Polynucleobacter TaxID=2640945 RepID=UPI001BFE52A4|nr:MULTISPECIES: molybdopterin cofactor-binding domain-containing protein [unclassified Polynucleobacter]MEA9604557.1 molybdopterin cofactor-binding domain-containing protein [Polynucleobacter sp. JS-JIR-II-c23]QWE02926.1 xanthine dehydrogenase family protein molybdopterin-binding subunit [Polynucleobacter sp. JS-JIR-II-b4]